jgi:hypothetical protein
LKSEANILEVVHALMLAGLFSSTVDRWHHHRQQCADDRNDHEQIS